MRCVIRRKGETEQVIVGTNGSLEFGETGSIFKGPGDAAAFLRNHQENLDEYEVAATGRLNPPQVGGGAQ